MKKLRAKKKGLLGKASDPTSQSPVINGTKKSQIKGVLRLRANLKALSSSPSTSLAMGELQDWIAQYPPPRGGGPLGGGVGGAGPRQFGWRDRPDFEAMADLLEGDPEVRLLKEEAMADLLEGDPEVKGEGTFIRALRRGCLSRA